MDLRQFFMGRAIGFLVVLILLGAWYLLWGRGPAGDYTYRCGDGTEFGMTPAEDLSSIILYPVTSVERIPETTLQKVESEFGARFESGALVFHGRGEGVQLIGQSFSTTCSPVSSGTEAPFNWGD